MSSSRATKRDTPSKPKPQTTSSSSSDTDANTTNDTNPTTEHTLQTRSATRTHARDEQTTADGARRKSTDSDLMAWAHLSVDRSGAKIRTICTRDHEDGETCSHTVRERRYRDIPRVDGPSEKVTVEGVEAMMERDAKVEREGDGEGDEGEGWVVIGRD